MVKKRIVIALGHQALGTNLPEQKAAVGHTAQVIADFIEAGWQVALVHSNAPQIGMIHTAMNEFGKQHDGYTAAPMSVCSAMSQGYIGYDLQNGIRTALIKRGIYKPVATVLTQVLVDPYDEAFYTPIKQVGRYLTQAEALAEEARGNSVVAKSPDQFQRTVAAPNPVSIVEADTIRALLDADQIVIACGGGGIPVMAQGAYLKGASAVIEKDLAAGLLAREMNADVLMILTGVEHVFLHYQTADETPLHHLSLATAKELIAANEFEAASILPKIQAAVDFLEAAHKKNPTTTAKAIITSLEQAKQSLLGQAGTCIE